MGDRTPGVVGTQPFDDNPTGGEENPTRRGGFIDPGPGGIDAPIPLVDRIIAQVDDDWHPPSPDTTATITLRGSTLADVARELDTLDEWGQGGGQLRSDRIPPGNSSNLTVQLRGNLILRMPSWPNYSSASAAAQRAWNHMFRKLQDHEQRHLDIAIEHGDALKAALVGKSVDDIARMVTEANRQMAAAQRKLDTDTDHGARAGVPYGDVTLDTSIP